MAGGAQFDIIMPSDYSGHHAQAGYAFEKLDLAKIPMQNTSVSDLRKPP